MIECVSPFGRNKKGITYTTLAPAASLRKGPPFGRNKTQLVACVASQQSVGLRLDEPALDSAAESLFIAVVVFRCVIEHMVPSITYTYKNHDQTPACYDETTEKKPNLPSLLSEGGMCVWFLVVCLAS